MTDRGVLLFPVLLAAFFQPLSAAAATASCQSDCYQQYQICYLQNPACQGVEFCNECEDQYQWCIEDCNRVCYTDVCMSCGRPASGADSDGDLVPDQLEYDLAHRFFPNVYLQDYWDDLGASYLGSGWSIPYTVKPYLAGNCDEDKECLEIRFGLAYRYDAGDPTWGGGHSGDSEFYAALVQRTSAWSTASADSLAWQMIRDFTAAHWGTSTDSSVVGAYGFCAPNCHAWDNDGSSCQANRQCHWFPGLCTGISNQPGTTCSSFWEEGECYFAGCTWYDSTCFSTSSCYSTSARTTQRNTYAAEGKHALYHTDSECDGGNIFNIDECPSNAYDMRAYKTGKLQNIGNWENHASFDTIIQYPDGCALYDVWSGAGFSNSTDYKKHFLYGFDWNLPAAAPPPTQCNGTAGQWSGCRGTGCHVCTEKVAGYPLYFKNHSACIPNSTCNNLYYTCNSNCPAPTSADLCNGTSGQWAGCRGTGCHVCSELVAQYPCYFQNHPYCVSNGGCAGLYFTCNSNCPAPTEADRCN